MSGKVGLFQKDTSKKPTRYYSNRQEKSIAKSLNGKQVANSGATAFAKGDINIGSDWLIEAKTKTSMVSSFSIKKEWLEKNLKESIFMHKKHSALAFNFGPDEPNYYIIDENLMKSLIECIKYIDNE